MIIVLTGFCKALVVLDISDNKIKELPPPLGVLPKLERLIIGNMPLVSPPINIQDEGEDAVLRFLKKFINGFERCYRYKLMVVGQENVGYGGHPLPPSLRDFPSSETINLFVSSIQQIIASALSQ